MKKINKEIRIGLITITAIFIFIFGVNFLKGLNIFDSSNTFYASYSHIDGLQVGSAVLVNGYKIGMVGDIDLVSGNGNHLLVATNIDKKFNIPNNSILKIVNQDLMGTKCIEIILGNSEVMANNGDTLESDIERSLQDEVNKQILPLKNKAEGLISSVDSLMSIITAVLDKNTRASLSNSLQSLDKTFLLLSSSMDKVNSLVTENDERVSRIIENIESVSSNLNSSNEEVRNILSNFSVISDSIVKSDIISIFKNIEELTKKINSDEGSLGLLINDDKVYKDLEKTTAELAELIKDIKKNPKRYMNFSVLGGSSKPYKK